MSKRDDDWGIPNLNDILGFDPWSAGFSFWGGPPGGKSRKRGRRQMFESGEIKFVILRLLKERPRHGYDIIKELEERFAGCYTPSAGTVYPTLQLLQDQGYIQADETEGKKVYQITPEGERFLEENSQVVDDMFERVRDTVRGFAGGHMGDLHGAFAKLASVTYRRAWRFGPDHPSIQGVVEVLRRATAEIEKEWERA